MQALNTDQRATLGLYLAIASLLVTLFLKLYDIWKDRRKEMSLAEQLRRNVVIREIEGSFGQREQIFVVNPKFIRRRKDGAFEVPTVGVLGGLKEDEYKELRSGDRWIECHDITSDSATETNLVIVQFSPPL